MKISLIHPSRGRPGQSYKNVREWIDKYWPKDQSLPSFELEIIVSLDFSDSLWMDYIMFYGGVVSMNLGCDGQQVNNIKFIQNNNQSVVEATNHAANKATGDILIYLSDDFKCPDNWGELILKEFEGVTEPMLLKVDDCLQGFHVPVLTIPIMNRALYEKLGYFFHPEYKSMFVDEDLYWTARKLGALKFAPHLKFPHEHVSIGKAQDDETYRRSAANWDQGKALFTKRKAAGFPL